MKAGSPVLDSVQRPPTVFGLPPALAGATAVVAAAVLTAFSLVLGLPTVGLFCFAAVLVAGLAGSWLLRARDPHVEEVLHNGFSFWRRGRGRRFLRGRQKGGGRILSAGGPG